MDPQVWFYIILIGGGLVIGGIAGAVWAFRQPDPNPKGKKTSVQDTGESQQQEV
jgi:hypothetical protein